MEKITVWLKLSAVVAIVSAVIMSVVPECRLKSSYKTLCALIILFALFSAFSSAESVDADFIRDSEKDSIYMSENTDELLIREGENVLDRMLENKLYEGGLEVKCKSEIVIEDNVMRVERVYIYGNLSKEEQEKAKDIVYLCVKEESEVIFAKESDEQ